MTISSFTLGVLAYCLLKLTRQLRDSTSKSTQALITKIVRLLLETGVLTGDLHERRRAIPLGTYYILTAGMAIGYAILTLFTPIYPCWFMTPGLSIGKLYANSMLVLLNNRFTIPGGRNAHHSDFDISSGHYPDRNTDISIPSAVPSGIVFAHSHPTTETILTCTGAEASTSSPNSQPKAVCIESEMV